jgi:hypothetical protein
MVKPKSNDFAELYQMKSTGSQITASKGNHRRTDGKEKAGRRSPA